LALILLNCVLTANASAIQRAAFRRSDDDGNQFPFVYPWLAIAIGGVTLLGVVLLILFFTFDGFFGTLNDLRIASEAILSALLAWMLYPAHRAPSPRLSQFMLITALVGTLVASIGSASVIFDITGWFLAGLMNHFGYALLGLWLLGLNYYFNQRRRTWPRRLVQFGLITGAIMAVGLLTGPGIVGRIDDPVVAPWFVNVGQLGSLGWLLLYPIWNIWLGRLLLSDRLRVQVGTQA
jgi:hypothetical protein